MRLIAAVVAVAALLGGCGGDNDGAVTYEATDHVTGEPVSVESLRGQPALLVSWTTWCRECDEELEGLQQFAASPAADGIEIVAVNLDAGDVTDEIDAKIAAHGLTTALWRDRQNGFKGTFGALGVPTSVLLDADGAVVETFPGAVDFEDAALLEALEEVRATGSS
jgi:peroxiredoxin